jgi:endonuclease III
MNSTRETRSQLAEHLRMMMSLVATGDIDRTVQTAIIPTILKLVEDCDELELRMTLQAESLQDYIESNRFLRSQLASVTESLAKLTSQPTPTVDDSYTDEMRAQDFFAANPLCNYAAINGKVHTRR